MSSNPSAFDSQAQRQVERLRSSTLATIEREVAQKRVAWCREHGITSDPQATPRQAYELLFRDYMGLDLDTLPVLSESESEITWSSRNACPTLVACHTLGLDTRQVCRASYEKSTQAFLSQIDPRLRFVRSYAEIRPHAGHCRESILRLDFKAMMALALAQARQSLAEGNKGYGAVVVSGGQVIAKAHDTAVVERDPSQHAELRAIRAAAQALGDANLCGAVLFSTCEPCPMCAGLAVWANLSAVVYGASIAETAALGKTRIHLSLEEVVSRSPVMVEVIGGVLKEECLELYRPRI
jgi:tRNA(Arg) A34 adenosine deaminase TadA